MLTSCYKQASRKSTVFVRVIMPLRPTHFLAFPISNPACQAKSQEVIDVLLKAKPRPDGVDESLAGSPRSLHLTLGIMMLATERTSQAVHGEGGQSVLRSSHLLELIKCSESIKSIPKPLPTVKDAARLLRGCRIGLRELLEEDQTKDIRVNLNRLESFHSDPKKCRVLYAEPEKGSSGVETLHQSAGKRSRNASSTYFSVTLVPLAAYVRERFHNEGLLSDYKQPLTVGLSSVQLCSH